MKFVIDNKETLVKFVKLSIFKHNFVDLFKICFLNDHFDHFINFLVIVLIITLNIQIKAFLVSNIP